MSTPTLYSKSFRRSPFIYKLCDLLSPPKISSRLTHLQFLQTETSRIHVQLDKHEPMNHCMTLSTAGPVLSARMRRVNRQLSLDFGLAGEAVPLTLIASNS